MKAVKRWQLLAAPAVTVFLSALDNPAVNSWSGGRYFLLSMSVMIALAAWELWRRRSGYHGAEVPMAVISGLVAVYYLFRCVAFILDGAGGSIFRTYFGSAVTTLLTITLLIVVSPLQSRKRPERPCRRRRRLEGLRRSLPGFGPLERPRGPVRRRGIYPFPARGHA